MFVHVHAAPALGGSWVGVSFFEGVVSHGNSQGYVEHVTHDLGTPYLTEAQALEYTIDALVSLRKRL